MGHLYHGKLLVITRRSRELTDVIDLMATLAFDHDFAVKDWGLSCLQPLAINHGCGKTNMHKTVGDGQCPSISIHDQLRLLEGIAWPLLAKQQNCLQHSHRNQWVRLIQAPRSLSGHTMRDTPCSWDYWRYGWIYIVINHTILYTVISYIDSNHKNNHKSPIYRRCSHWNLHLEEIVPVAMFDSQG